MSSRGWGLREKQKKGGGGRKGPQHGKHSETRSRGGGNWVIQKVKEPQRLANSGPRGRKKPLLEKKVGDGKIDRASQKLGGAGGGDERFNRLC